MRLHATAVRLACALLAAWPGTAADLPEQAASLPDAGEVIRRLIERAGAEAGGGSAGTLIFWRTNITEEFDRKGRVEEREELLLRVTVREDDKTVELLTINGREPTARERERELKRFQREGSGKRDRPDRSRQLEAYFTTNVLGRYVFTVDGREVVAGRICLKVAFKPGVIEKKSEKLFERVLDKIHGVFWIDEADYELARADIELGEKVSMWGGVLGLLEQLHLQVARVRDESGRWRDHTIEARFVGRAFARHMDIRTVDISSAPEQVVPTPVVAAD